MTVARSAAEVLADHVTLEVECIDRLYLNVYVPRLQFTNGVVHFLRGHRGHRFASSALLEPISRAFVAGLHRFIKDQGVDMVDFAKGQRKDDVAHEYLSRFEGTEGVLFVGRAQERTAVFRTEKRRNPVTGATYPWIVRSSAMVNHFYVYALDQDFGPFFLTFASYFPYNAKLCVNGNEWAKRQAAKAGIGFEALDDGFAACDDPDRLQRICDRLGPVHIDRLLRKWLARLPHPFTAADRRGATATTCRSCRPSSLSPRCWTGRCRVGCSSRRWFERTSTSAVPTGCRWCSTGASTSAAGARPRPATGPGCSPRASRRRCMSSTSRRG
jgi:hypothetical protein